MNRTPIPHEDGISYLVPLTRGFFARIDADDLDKVSRYTWSVSRLKQPYATTTVGWGEYQKRIAMHRLVTDCQEGMVPDHINSDTLDNRKANLRICTPSENSQRKQKKSPEQKAAEAANKEHPASSSAIAIAISKPRFVLNWSAVSTFRAILMPIFWRSLSRLPLPSPTLAQGVRGE